MCNFFEILDAQDHKWKHVVGRVNDLCKMWGFNKCPGFGHIRPRKKVRVA